MDLKQFGKVYTLYLKGYSYSEIEKSAGVPKSTVQRWIQDFKNGDIGMYRDTLPYIEELASVGKFMRESGIELPDIKSAAVVGSIVKSLGIGINDLIGIGNALKDINNPEIVREVSWTLTNLMEKGLKPSELQENINSMNKEMEEKQEELARINARIEDHRKAEQEEKERVIKMNEELSTAKKNLEEIKMELDSIIKEKEGTKSLIENAKRIERFIQKNDIDLDQLGQFYSKARKHNLDIKRICSLRDMEDFGLDSETDTNEISDIVKSLDSLYKKGWDHKVLRHLDMVTENTNVRPADAVDDLLRYYKETEYFENSLSSLREEEKELREGVASKSREYAKLEDHCSRITIEAEEARKQKESLENEISALIQTKIFAENGITDISQISSKITEKRVELNRILYQIKTAEESLIGIRNETEIEKLKVKAAQEFYDLMKFGTPDTVGSLKYSIERALDSEDGNMNQKSATERYRYARETAIKLLLEIAGDGIGGIKYFNTSKLRFIDGKEFDDLVSCRNRINEIQAKENEIRHDLNEINENILKFISDIVAGRSKPTPEVDMLIVRITESVIRDQLKRETEDAESYKSLLLELRGSFNLSAVTVKGWDRESKIPVAGLIYPADFASALQSGDYIKITNGSGGINYIDLCTVMRQILLYKFNYNFFKHVQDEMFPGKVKIVRSSVARDVPNKQDENGESQQLSRQHRLYWGTISGKNDKGDQDKKLGH